MSFLGILSQILLYVFLFGLFFLGLKHAFSLYLFSRKKEEITKLDARLSILKLHLKGKIKRKCNKIESAFRTKNPEMLNILRSNLNALLELRFSLPEDYQKLINLLGTITQDVINHLKIEPESDTTTTNSLSEKNDKLKTHEKLIKYDRAHILIVVDIIQTTEQLIEKSNEFNTLIENEKKQKKIHNIPEKIEIEDYEAIIALLEPTKSLGADKEKNPIKDVA